MRIAAGLLVAEIVLAGSASAATFAEGRSLYMRNRVAEAEGMYAKVASDSSASPADRSSARRELARISWLIDGKADQALRHLEAARSIGAKPCDTALLTARILREAGRNREAIERGDALLGACKEARDRDGIAVELVQARLDLSASGATQRARLLADASAQAAALGPDIGLEGSRARLEIGLMTGNADAAMRGWREYFWLEEGADAPQALEGRGAAGIFASGLKPGSSEDERLKLAELLMRAGFAEQARRYAATNGMPGGSAQSPIWRKLQAYWQMRDTFGATLLKVNRGLARGQRDETALENAAKEATIALMTAAGATGDPRSVLLEHYGMFGTGAGKTSGYPSIHMGHAVEDRKDEVAQYGTSASIRFVAVDNMIGNGFESWLWDGAQGVGGWQANGVIAQVRPRYVHGPIRFESLRGDSKARRELIERQPIRAAEDIAKLKARPIATLDGLNDRLQLQLADRIEAAARSRATDEEGVRRAFLAEVTRANFEHSILVHEGRHAVDEVLGVSRSDQVTLEYQAKLSELALADYPRMGLRAINSNLEGDSPHDRAGARLFEELRLWMEANRGQVLGYDPAIPALAQLDKLMDNQLREIARGLDPLAKAPPAAKP